MEIRANLSMIIRSLTGTLLFHLAARLTTLELFAWLAMFASVWLFLNLFWLIIICMDYLLRKLDSVPAIEQPRSSMQIRKHRLPPGQPSALRTLSYFENPKKETYRWN